MDQGALGTLQVLGVDRGVPPHYVEETIGARRGGTGGVRRSLSHCDVYVSCQPRAVRQL